MSNKIKDFMLLLYFPIYLIWFSFIEKAVTNHFHIIHLAIDDKIPFIEYFVVPYIIWFPYVAVVVVFVLFTDHDEYIKLCKFLFTGMTLFLIISTIYPNGHYLRPMAFESDNIFVRLTQMIYSNDTATNLFPSIHVFNSIGVNIAVQRSKLLENKKIIRNASTILCISIIASTMFLKQHSVFDVLCGFILSVVMYRIVYWKSEHEVAYEASAQHRYS